MTAKINEGDTVTQIQTELNSIQNITNLNTFYEVDSKDNNEAENICMKVQALDFTLQQPQLNIADDINTIYINAYLKILRSEIPTTNFEGNKEFFQELYGVGTKFDEIDERYLFCYNDLDGDGLPELGIKSTGYTYILKYEPDISEFNVIFSGPTMYYTILGVRQIGYHDGLHAGVIRDRFLILNENDDWEIVLDLERGTESPPFYQIGTDEFNKIDVSEEIWNEITRPFFKAMEQPFQFENLHEVFGELL